MLLRYISISRSSWFKVFWPVVRLLVAEQVHETGVLGTARNYDERNVLNPSRTRFFFIFCHSLSK